MIYKFYELNKIDINLNSLILFHGNNEGLKKEETLKLFSNKKIKISKYEEKEIIENPQIFFENLYSGSLFENKKFISINRVTDKIIKIIDEVINKGLENITIILNANILEKKSKLRSKFEKDRNLVCVAFYPDTNETLSRLAKVFFKNKNITVSQMNINFIVNKCNGNREFLNNELLKIESFAERKKNISDEDLIQLINLNENYSISELIDNFS